MFAVKTQAIFSHSTLKIVTTERQFANVFVTCQDFCRKRLPLMARHAASHHLRRSASKALEAVVSGVNDNEILPSSIDDFTVATSSPDKGDQLKIAVEVSGSKTQEIYDEVFSKMVEDAQPIPGFRRAKGGKTPNIPKDILLEILGPSNVYEQVIKKLIQYAISEYVAKERLAVGKDLEIKQSLEDLLAEFEPGNKFRFDAIVQLQDLK